MSRLICNKGFNKALSKTANSDIKFAFHFNKTPLKSADMLTYHNRCTAFTKFQTTEIYPFEINVPGILEKSVVLCKTEVLEHLIAAVTRSTLVP